MNLAESYEKKYIINLTDRLLSDFQLRGCNIKQIVFCKWVSEFIEMNTRGYGIVTN
jgi:hypothetical protein